MKDLLNILFKQNIKLEIVAVLFSYATILCN
jgi:hypothetical protein